jgi:hypothetical protein
MMNCSEVTRKLASGETPGLRKLLMLRLHLLMCARCQAYSRQIKAMGAALRSFVKRESAIIDIPKLEDETLKKLFTKK